MNLATFTNEKDGVTAFVTQGANGYHVSLRDDDSGEFVGVVVIYKMLDTAIAKAQQVAA